MWKQRVAGWRASGLTAAVYSARHGLAANSLRWWSSKLARDGALSTPAVRFAQLMRSPVTAGESARRGVIVVEFLDAHVRVSADAGADRETLAHLVELVLGRATR
jgi:hypothetical protein